MKLNFFHSSKPFPLENGDVLPSLTLAYSTAGKLNEKKDNVVWVCHALTGNTDVFDWWKGFVGEEELINPEEYFIICVNVLGSPYGSTQPLSINPTTGKPYYLQFPLLTIRDIAKANLLVADALGLDRIHLLIGGSLGGQQALEMCMMNQVQIDQMLLLATNHQHSPWGIAYNESQRMAIESDETFYQFSADAARAGLSAARSIALLSYRSYEAYQKTQQDSPEVIDSFRASSYQQYQGEKLVQRFNAYSYWYLTKAMDSHNVARGRGSAEEVLGSITMPTLVIGIDSDGLFPPSEQQFLASNLANAQAAIISSVYGHDGFLIETEKITKLVRDFLLKNTIEKEEYMEQNISCKR